MTVTDRRVPALVLLSILFILLATAAGCAAKPEPGIVSYWPKAQKERVVAKPPEPPRWPLTGLEAPSADAITSRVVSVKIENSPAARPQTNLQAADVVYETIVEGGITRFNCLFHSTEPDEAGPVRSARFSDIYIVPQYGALFVFSGANSQVNNAVNQADIDNLSQDAGVSYPYYRSNKRSAPHNLYLVFSKLHEEAERRGMAVTQEPKGLVFDKAASTTATPTVTVVDIRFSPANRVQWAYDRATRTYLRMNNGRVHTDAATGRQLSARNVVVLWVRYTKPGTTTRAELVGSGRCTLFRDGQRLNGTWEATRDAPPRFKAADGTQIKLAPGNTWFQVIETDSTVTMK